jgi:alpha-L-arabinofuranosidase
MINTPIPHPDPIADADSEIDAQTLRATLTIHADQPGKPISTDLIGIFFEDLNYAADGGLYAELIQNRSFEYKATEQPSWNSLTGWDLTVRGDGSGNVSVSDAVPVHPNTPHYAILTVKQVGDGVGLVNRGFDGIAIKAGEAYHVSMFVRQLNGTPGPLTVRLESRSGKVYAEATLPAPTGDWTRVTATLEATEIDADACFVLLVTNLGAVAIDVVSLFPKNTFHQRPNGLRADLAQVIADLKPKFVRFPGGCLVHGDGIGNMYRWKDTIGPIETRRAQRNIWRYHQTVGLGYFEYFQFCEDIGAKPLPVVPAGVCCQNASIMWGTGQQGLPIDQMQDYIQEVLDLVEYANGPATSTWGAKRAEAGHPEPFNLEYLGIGNEDAQTPLFRERFEMIYRAVKAKYPEITLIGTVGPEASGDDFDAGWKFADELRVDMVDEHYYVAPEWFLANTNRYDGYDRSRSKVYLGEYATWGNRLLNALAEAAYLTRIECNGDIVRMASYAPLLAKVGHTQWNPDLIYFTNTSITRTANYYVQQMFSTNAGDVYLDSSLEDDSSTADLFASCVRDSRSGDLIIKLVNASASPRTLRVDFAGEMQGAAEAVKTVLTGDPTVVNEPGGPEHLVPITSTMTVGPTFDDVVHPHSLTIIRIRDAKPSER